MYMVTSYDKFGVITEVEKLDNKQYEIIAHKQLAYIIAQNRPDLLCYDDKTCIATTSKAKELQEYLNSFKDFKEYQIIFIQ